MGILVGFVVLVFVALTIAALTGALRQYREEVRDPVKTYELGLSMVRKGRLSQAHIYFEHAAKLGDAESAFLKGKMLHDAIGCSRDAEAAFKWITLAADRGLPRAMFEVAEMYQNGDGTERNLAMSYRFYKLASAKGVPEADSALDEFEQWNQFQWDYSIPITEEEHRERRLAVVSYFRSLGTIDGLIKAVDAGHRESALELSLKYLTGDGVPHDVHSAHSWMSKAAEMGSRKAMIVLDLVRPERNPNIEDLKEPFALYERAVESDEGKYEIGCRFRDGVGTPPNITEAATWFLMSYKYGPSREALEDIPRSDWPEEMQEVELPERSEAAAT